MSLFSIRFWSRFSSIRLLGFEYVVCRFGEPDRASSATLPTARLRSLFLRIFLPLPSRFPVLADLSLIGRVFVFIFFFLIKKNICDYYCSNKYSFGRSP